MRKASSRDKAVVVALHAQAFDANPSVNYIIRQGKGRERRIRRLMEYSFELCLRFGAVYLSAEDMAAALLLFPDQKKTSLQTVWLDMQLALGAIGLGKIKRVIARESLIHEGYPKAPFLYLWFMGVDPRFQGKGLGSKLLQEIIWESSCTDRPIYLETSLPENVAFYQKQGFKVYRELFFGHTLYCLQRPAEDCGC